MSIETSNPKLGESLVYKGLGVPFVLLVICFALWGAANNMTDLLVTVFKQVKGMSATEASLIQSAFYGAYFCMAIPAAIVIQRFSYKTAVVAGLVIYALGAFLCFPASQADSFTFFLVAFYVFAAGCAFLETSVAPYVLSMGPEATATRRINMAQSFNPIGSVSGIFLGKAVILSALTAPAIMATLEGADKIAAQSADLSLVVKAYAIVGFIALVLGLIILIKKFPEAKDNESFAEGDEGMGAAVKRLFKNRNYVSAVVAQFFYVGAQIGVWTYVVPYVMAAGIGYDIADDAWWFYLASLVLFLFSRFVCTYLMKFIDPAKMMSTLAIVAIALSAGAVLFSGWIGVISVVGISACMSLMFPTIYGLGLTGVGDDRKIGGSGIIMAIVGGAVLVPTQAVLIDAYSVSTSYLLPMVCFGVVAIYGNIAHAKEVEVGIVSE